MRTFAALIVAILLGAVEARAQTPDIQNPVWLERPNGEDFRQNYPSQAVEQSVEGRATLECLVRLDTTVDCSVIAESPASWGFGDAALAIARSFRVAPARVDGQPVEGGRIRNTIRFVLPPVEDSYEGLSPEQRAIEEAFADLDLPNWEEAPTTSSVLVATPHAAREANVQGRGILSCRVNRERRLRCRPFREMPADSGFGVAAMRLAPQFLVAQSSQQFADAHRTEPFLLPIVFGGAPEVTPVSRHHTGLEPLDIPLMRAPQDAIPPEALAARINGTASVLCNIGAGLALTCSVEAESPAGWGFGAVVLGVASSLPAPPASLGFIPGDQIRFRAEFVPE
ncbi:MAG: energy transducer TonB [Hyphomonadaceae bacterium]|nr:energy transducer TonB [Hyphomonadaceae bacterium]